MVDKQLPPTAVEAERALDRLLKETGSTVRDFLNLEGKHSRPGCVVRSRHAEMIMVLAGAAARLLILPRAWPGGAFA
jgi:hypothetical protein